MNGDVALQYKARVIMAAAISRGDLVRQPCVRCGNPKSHGHHPDYSKPLDVVWLCAQHHNEVHGRIAKPKSDFFRNLEDRVGRHLATKLEERLGHDWNHEETI